MHEAVTQRSDAHRSETFHVKIPFFGVRKTMQNKKTLKTFQFKETHKQQIKERV